MNKVLPFFIISAVILFSGCGLSLNSIESDYTIKISGTVGTKFKGNYSIPGSGSIGIPTNVEGVIPFEYKGRGVSALCMFRKTEAVMGTLKVEIFKDKTIVAASETAAPLGVVTIGKTIDQNSIINTVIGKLLEMLKL